MSGFNLYDYSKAFFSDGAPVPVSKVLVKASPIFATAIVVEGNRDNGHEYAIQNVYLQLDVILIILKLLLMY